MKSLLKNKKRHFHIDSVSTELNRIVCGDVLDVLSSIPAENTFDVVVADPPYNIGKNFGNNTTKESIDIYVLWVEEWINRCMKLLTENGLLYVYGLPEVLARVAVKYPLEKQRWLVWHYTNKTTPSSQFWQRSHESILCLWQGSKKRPVLEIDQIREPYTKTYLHQSAGKLRKVMQSRFNNGKKTIYKAHSNGALPRDVIKIPALAGGAGAAERWFMCYDCERKVYPPNNLKHHVEHTTFKHPTQKPMRLTRKLIQSRVRGSNGRVLIPFAGSGSECVVAKQLDIDFLGVEINPDYVEFANKWLGYV